MPTKKQYWALARAIKEAEKIGIEVSKPTLIKWIKKFQLGFQLGHAGGKWYVFPYKYTRFINGGKTQTLKAQNNVPIESDEEENDQA